MRGGHRNKRSFRNCVYTLSLSFQYITVNLQSLHLPYYCLFSHYCFLKSVACPLPVRYEQNHFKRWCEEGKRWEESSVSVLYFKVNIRNIKCSYQSTAISSTGFTTKSCSKKVTLTATYKEISTAFILTIKILTFLNCWVKFQKHVSELKRRRQLHVRIYYLR